MESAVEWSNVRRSLDNANYQEDEMSNELVAALIGALVGGLASGGAALGGSVIVNQLQLKRSTRLRYPSVGSSVWGLRHPQAEVLDR